LKEASAKLENEIKELNTLLQAKASEAGDSLDKIKSKVI